MVASGDIVFLTVSVDMTTPKRGTVFRLKRIARQATRSGSPRQKSITPWDTRRRWGRSFRASRRADGGPMTLTVVRRFALQRLHKIDRAAAMFARSLTFRSAKLRASAQTFRFSCRKQERSARNLLHCELEW